MCRLEDAIALAARAHRGQTDKGGATYILHPLRVMAQMKTDRDRIVAVLHDVVEDTPITLDELRGLGFAEELVEAVDAVTRRTGERPDRYIGRVKTNPIARRVKIADLEDNLDIRRLPKVTDRDGRRLQIYRSALRRLTEAEPA